MYFNWRDGLAPLIRYEGRSGTIQEVGYSVLNLMKGVAAFSRTDSAFFQILSCFIIIKH